MVLLAVAVLNRTRAWRDGLVDKNADVPIFTFIFCPFSVRPIFDTTMAEEKKAEKKWVCRCLSLFARYLCCPQLSRLPSNLWCFPSCQSVTPPDPQVRNLVLA